MGTTTFFYFIYLFIYCLFFIFHFGKLWWIMVCEIHWFNVHNNHRQTWQVNCKESMSTSSLGVRRYKYCLALLISSCGFFKVSIWTSHTTKTVFTFYLNDMLVTCTMCFSMLVLCRFNIKFFSNRMSNWNNFSSGISEQKLHFV